MPARRRRQHIQKDSTQNRPLSRRKVIVTLLVIVVVCIFAFALKPLHGRKIVVAPSGEDVIVAVFDFDAANITRINIPGTTEINVSRQYGKWKIGSVWKLAQSERLSGHLLADTTLKSIHFPVDTWSNSTLADLLDGRLSGSMLFVVNSQNTGLNLLERIQLMMFSIQNNKASRETINLSDTSYLSEGKLSDGMTGYQVTDRLPVRLAAIMSAPGVGNRVVRVGINNAGGEEFSSEVHSLVTTLEVIGTKVLSVKNVEVSDSDCVIQGDAKDSLVVYLSDVFGCKTQSSTGNFDIEMNLGKKFMERF